MTQVKSPFTLTHSAVALLAASTLALTTPAPAQEPVSTSALADNNDPIQRGSYLATAGNCMTCHTREGGDQFAGGVAFHTDFGVIYSTNITSDETSGIGAWTEGQFIRAMHKGKSADGSNLYPAFPYPSFSKVSVQDLTDLFAFFKTVAPSSDTPPDNDMGFPFNQRSLLGVWNYLFFDGARFEADSTQSENWNRGAYLVEGLGHCGTCHTPRNALGGLQSDHALSGGTYNDKVEGDKIRPWSAVNLTSAADGLAAWSEDDIASYLKTGHGGTAGSFGPMNEVITMSSSQLNDGDVRAIALYLKSLAPIERAPQHEMGDQDFRAGELVYTIHCGTCHLPTGLGDPSIGPQLAGSSIVQAEDPASLINVIIYGAETPTPAPPSAWKNMEAFGDKLDDDEIALLSTYLRSNWGNRGGPVTEAHVGKQR
ncbi:MAG: cytochrome c [Rhodospirillaceae bacterium]|nr:cytochrome c [Rhodospirillaceae bacterium]